MLLHGPSSKRLFRFPLTSSARTEKKSRASLSIAVAKAASRLESLPAEDIIENHQALEGITRSGNRLHGWSAEAETDRLAVVNLAFLATPASALPDKVPLEVQAQPEPQPQLEDSH